MQLNLTDENQIINFSKKGKYKLLFIGGFYVKNKGHFKINIKNEKTNEFLNIKIPFLKVREFIGFKRAVHYANFEIQNEGNYIINFENIDNLIIKKSMLLLKNIIFPFAISSKSIIVEIRK